MSASESSLTSQQISHLLAAFEEEERTRAHRANIPLASKPEPGAAEWQGYGVEPLSRQELRVLRLLIAGPTYVEMAVTLIVSPNTIKTQVSSIYRKLGVSRRAEATSVAGQLRLF